MIKWFTDHPQDFNDWTVSWLSPWPWPIKALVGLAALGAAAYALWALWDLEKRRRRLVLAGLRLLGVLLLVVVFFEPAFTVRKITRLKNRVVVLVDRSRSMDLPARSGHTRLDETQAFLRAARGELQRRNERFDFEFFAFDQAAQRTDLNDLLAQGRPVGARTDLTAALGQAIEDPTGRKLGGVLLLSDGADNVDPGLALAQEIGPEDLPARLAQIIKKLDAPLYTYCAGGRRFTDLAVARVIADDFAFVRNTMEIEVILKARGMPDGEVPVSLESEGKIISTKRADLIGDPAEARVRFLFAPQHVGKYVYTVSVPAQEGEAVTENNRQSFIVKVIRDKVRVLHVAGILSWDVRFLRWLLKRDPNVDLISFFILRTPEDYSLVRNDELSLIPFPVEELFAKQIQTFDVVIFQNFDFAPYQMERYLKNIRDFVSEAGGGFAMIGGDRSFGSGQYGGTPLEAILPVELGAGNATDFSHFRPRLTEAGRRHPILDLGSEAPAEQILPNLPDLFGLNIAGPKPRASVLLDHPFLSTAQGGAPVLAAAEVGKGRSLALLTDSLWRWDFDPDEAKLGHRAYSRFWHNALRWLIKDPELKTLSVVSSRSRYEPGEDADVEVIALDHNYTPAPGARLDLTVTPLAPGAAPATATGVTGPDGRFHLRYPAAAGGPHRVTVKASLEGGETTEEEVFVVSEASPELAHAAPRCDVLEALAKASGGKSAELPGGSPGGWNFADPKIVRVDRREDTPIWDRWSILILLACLLSVDWFLRRRWGLI